MTIQSKTSLDAVLIGNESLLVQCAEIWKARGHGIVAVITRSGEIETWAEAQDLRVVSSDADLGVELAGEQFDWLLSIANLDMLNDDVLRQPAKGAVNFHDGPLPRYAGLNAPVWAKLNGETRHGITWHMMEAGADTGDILVQRMFDVADSDTALTLNTSCYSAAIDSFPELVDTLEQGAVTRTAQDVVQRSYFSRAKRPEASARLDFRRDAKDIVALVQALDHGDYYNPMTCAKIVAAGQVLTVGEAATVPAESVHPVPGSVLQCDDDGVVVACGREAVVLRDLRDRTGIEIPPARLIRAGDTLPMLDKAGKDHLTEVMKAATPAGEVHWRKRLADQNPTRLPLVGAASDVADLKRRELTLPAGLTTDQLIAAIAVWAWRSGAHHVVDVAYRGRSKPSAPGYLSDWVPMRIDLNGDSFSAVTGSLSAERAICDKNSCYALDLVRRDPAIAAPQMPDVAISMDEGAGPVSGACLSFALGGQATLHYDATRISEAHLDRLVARLELLAKGLVEPEAQATAPSALPMLPEAERNELLTGWNETVMPFDPDHVMHVQFEERAASQPDAVALIAGTEQLTYGELNARANRVAHVLQEMGVKPGTLVGLFSRRSLDLVVSALGILKAGGAYVPLDPAYPADRLAHYIEDSGAPVIVTQSGLAGELPPHQAQVLEVDADPRLETASTDNLQSGVNGGDLAYLIYTSGSTGTPKGVMVEHGNVANFFVGMDERVSHKPSGTWMAVTSLSFDISVLELFYSLARGFKLVLSGDENRMEISGSRVPTSEGGMEFSIYYWGNDDGAGRQKYDLLLEGAKFADQNGFTAVWTPERHFHAFGGPYPNPSVTGAAVAAVTKNIGVRSGSCVTPLHHTLRIAEEWAVIDNLTDGKAGLAVAAGWQPDDFVLRPENALPKNKDVMIQQMADLRKLWRGEPVEFPRPDGSMFAAVTQPRPVSKELEMWVTIAGNPDTWREAGRHGAHVLTHLLGQSIEEVEGKIKIYHEELRKAGHDPADFKVSLMLHTFVSHDREHARETARGPMKAYMGAAAGLIKQYAWAFPAFKRPKGVDNAFDLDLGVLEADEVDAILDFAFLRYFEDSGMFGTVEDCLDRVEQLKRIGVTEVACLIDYGIENAQVMEGLEYLAEVNRRANAGGELAEEDVSIAAQILRHDVTHLQCTPSMARMLVMNDEARFALSKVNHLMIGGEALPGALVAELNAATRAGIENMYGPTETTIWSTTSTADTSEGVVNIGTPIVNTQVYVLDEDMQPVPVGVAGEMFIGGAGVTRGYHHREDLTAERFVANPFGEGRLYRTGDLVRWRSNGALDFLGRADHQVKLRGHRIELGEIESRLEALPQVDQAVVIAREDTPGDTRLVAYVHNISEISEDAMRVHLSAQMPDYMVPAFFVHMDSFPLTPNRKVDRKALPAPVKAAAPVVASESIAFVAPEGGTAEVIAGIWQHVLGVDGISQKDNFFELGGHSLLAVQAHREIRQALSVDKLSITDIFRFPVLSDLMARVDDLRGVNKPAPEAAAQLEETDTSREDAMSKRRAMRARRSGRRAS